MTTMRYENSSCLRTFLGVSRGFRGLLAKKCAQPIAYSAPAEMHTGKPAAGSVRSARGTRACRWLQAKHRGQRSRG